MRTATLVSIGLGVVLASHPVALAAPPPPPIPSAAVTVPRGNDPVRLREMLHDHRHPRNQSQAALLLLQLQTPEADAVIRQALRQTGSPDVFEAMASALRIALEARFSDDLVAALSSGHAEIRNAAAEALATLTDTESLLRLQALAGDKNADPVVQQTALGILGRSGRKGAAVILLDHLSHPDESLRRAAAEALADLSGQDIGVDVERWREWWKRHQNLPNESWLEERLAYQASRSRRLEGDLDKARTQVVRLHQQLHDRMPAADRLGHAQSVADSEDPAVRALGVSWAVELLPAADALGQRALADLLLRSSRDGSVEVQRPAVLALGRVADVRVFGRLLTLLRKGQPAVRAAAARALAQQVNGTTPDARSQQRQAIPALQKALDDPALEVVVEVAENLGALGVPEAGPVLAVLLHHPSEPVRLAAAQALERAADCTVLDGLLEALDDPGVTVRFSLIGALGRAVGDGRSLTDSQKTKLHARLETLLGRDADPGVRSRVATLLGQCGPPTVLAALWKRVQPAEDPRVQEKAWAAMTDILARTASLERLREWEHTVAEAGQEARRVQLIQEVCGRWGKADETRSLAVAAGNALVPTLLEQKKWAAAIPLLRELANASGTDAEIDQRARWLLAVGELALKEQNKAEAARVVQEAKPILARRAEWTEAFEKLKKQAMPDP